MENKFNIVKKGYSMEEVDDYIRGLEKELDEYKKKEAAINSTLISAQLVADNTKKKAEIEANDLKEEAFDSLNKLKDIITNQKSNIKNFYEDYNNLMAKYFKKIDDEDVDPILFQIDTIVDVIESGADEMIASTSIFTPISRNLEEETEFENNIDYINDIDNIEKELTMTEVSAIKEMPPNDPPKDKKVFVLDDADKEIVFKFPRKPVYTKDDAYRELLNK